MRPLLYSEKEASEKKIGWMRAGEEIRYYRNNVKLVIMGYFCNLCLLSRLQSSLVRLSSHFSRCPSICLSVRMSVCPSVCKQKLRCGYIFLTTSHGPFILHIHVHHTNHTSSWGRNFVIDHYPLTRTEILNFCKKILAWVYLANY